MNLLTDFRRMTFVAAVVAAISIVTCVGTEVARAHAVLFIGTSTLGMVWVWSGVRRHRPRGAAWRVLVAASTLWCVCALFWALPVALGGHQPVSPSMSDAGWILTDLLTSVGVILAMCRRETRRFVILDVLTIVVGLGLVVGVGLVGPDFATSIVPMDVRLTAVGYVTADVVMMAVGLRLLLAPRRSPGAAWLVAGALFATAFSDIAWNWLTISGTYAPSGWGDIGWDLQPLLLGLAALHPSMRRFGEREAQDDTGLHRAGPLLLGAVALVAPVLLGLHQLVPWMPAIDGSLTTALAVMLGGAALAALTVTRFSLLLRRARTLADELAAKVDVGGRMLDVSEARHQRLVEQLPGIIYVVALGDDETSARPVYVNPQLEAITGVSRDPWLAGLDDFLRTIHTDDRAGVTAMVERARAGLRPEAIEFRCLGPDGREVWLRDASGVVSGEGPDRHLQLLLFDVTAAKQAEVERDRMELELRLAQKLEAVGQLAAGIAHEINTPIQFVGDTVRFLGDAFDDLIGLTESYGRLSDAAVEGPVPEALIAGVHDAEQLADLEYLTERVPAALVRANDGLGRVTAIVRAMGEFAHPSSDEPTPVDVNRALLSTLVVTTSKYKYAADVVTELGDLPLVMGDGGELNQVFLNLVVNAAHAIEDVVGGTAQRGVITVRTAHEGDLVRISVSDTGGGIRPEIAARIYDPFFTTKAVGRGTGQGLSIVRTLVERNGGRVTFETQPGCGTTFHVELPLVAPATIDREGLAA